MDSHLNDNLEEVAGRSETRSAKIHYSDLSEGRRHLEEDRQSTYEQAIGRLTILGAKAVVRSGTAEDLRTGIGDLASATDALLPKLIDRFDSDHVNNDPLESYEERVCVEVGLSLTAWTCLFGQKLLNAGPRQAEINAQALENLIDSILDSLEYSQTLTFHISAALCYRDYPQERLRSGVYLAEIFGPYLAETNDKDTVLVESARAERRENARAALSNLSAEALYEVAALVRNTALEQRDLSATEVPF